MHTFALLGPLLEPKFYTQEWLTSGSGASHRVPPHMDAEMEHGRKIALRRLFQDSDMLEEAEEGFVDFSTSTGRFGGYDVLRDRGCKKPYSWWENHGETSPILQKLSLRIISQVTSSSCCERNCVISQIPIFSISKQKR